MWSGRVKRIILALFVASLPVFLYQACGPSFSGKTLTASTGLTGPLSEPPVVTEGKVLYERNCAGCHGPLDNSAKAGRGVAAISSAVSTIPQMASLMSLSGRDLEAIAKALEVGSSAVGGANPFLCEAGQDPGSTDLRRLSRREYTRTLEALLSGYVTLSQLQSQLDLLPTDTVTEVFDSLDPSVSANHVQSYLAVAKQAASLLVSQPRWLDSQLKCNYAQGLTDSCWNNFFNDFALRVYRRPLTAQEKADYRSLFQNEGGNTLLEGLPLVVQTLLHSPHFVYKVETQGAAVAGKTNVLQLGDYELASRLAFFATGRGPDAELLADAAAGRLSNEASYKTVVNRVFGSQAAKDHVREFYFQWLGLNRLPTLNQSNWFHGSISKEALRSEALQEMDDFMSHILWSSKGTYRDLLLSEANFTRGPALAAVYGVTASGGSSGGAGDAQSFEGENMQASTGRVEDNGWNLYTNGTLSQALNLQAGREYTLVIRARGQIALGVGPQMIVRFGNQNVGETAVQATSYTDYTFRFTPSQASGNLVLEFTNDVYDQNANQDRNLFVDKVSLSTPQVAGQPPASTPGQLPLGERPGILSRAAMLVGATNQPSIVHRGLIIRRNLLCDKISNPTILPGEEDLFKAPEPNPLESMRKQIEVRTSPARCQSCHNMLNPSGFVLQNYDSLGRYQTSETIYDTNGNIRARHAVDALVTPNIETRNEATVNGLKEFATAMTESSKGPACMTKQWFTYSMGREPAQADSCSLSHMYRSLLDAQYANGSGDTGATVLNMLKATAFDPNFKIRKVGPAQ